MGQKGSTEQRRIKNILSNHAGLQVQYPYEFFRRRLDYAISTVLRERGPGVAHQCQWPGCVFCRFSFILQEIFPRYSGLFLP